MDLVEIKILETVIAIVLFLLLRLGISKLISRTGLVHPLVRPMGQWRS